MILIRLTVAMALLAGCAAPEPQPPLWQAERGVIWCYRTLGAPECHASPLVGAASRLIAAGPEIFFTPAAAAIE